MSVYKKLKASDVSITPFEAHKQYSYDSSSAGANGITFRTTLWTSESKDHYSVNNLAGNFYHHRDYFQFDKGFYRNYILNHSNLIPETNYIKQERRKYDKLNILSIPQNLFGSEIQATTFRVTGSFGGTQIEIRDDGEGNLYPTTYTLGESNWPSEKDRIVYIGPVEGYKNKDLTVDNNTGFKKVNGDFSSFTKKRVHDDSYFLNKVDYIGVNFEGDTPLTFINLTDSGYIKLPHNEKYNFETNKDFSINFYYKLNSTDIANVNGTADGDEFYIIAKADKKTIVPSPQEGQSEILSTFTSGNMQFIDVPSGNQYPFKVYYKNTQTNTGSLYFERSNGTATNVVTASLFYADDSVGDLIHICVQKTGNSLEIYKNGVLESSKNDISFFNKELPTKNQANLYIGSKGGDEKFLNSNLSQIMIWDQALTSTQIQNISQSITGTPYIGNLFYSEGFATITHPSYTSYLFNEYSGSLTSNFTIEPTYGDENNYDVVLDTFGDPLWNADVTFYDEELMFNGMSPTNYSFLGVTTEEKGLAGNYYYFGPKLLTYLANKIDLNPINKEADRFDYMTASYFDTGSITTQPFLPSGSLNSITTQRAKNATGISPFNEFAYAFLSCSTVTYETPVNILYATQSTNYLTDSYGSNLPSDLDDSAWDINFNYLSPNGFEVLLPSDTGESVLGFSGSNDNYPYFKGALKRFAFGGGQSVSNNEDWVTVNFTNSEQDLPPGLVSGINLDVTSNEISTISQPLSDLKFNFTGKISGVADNSGGVWFYSIRLLKDGSEAGYFEDSDGPINGRRIFDPQSSVSIDSSITIPLGSLGATDDFAVQVKVFDNTGGSTIDYNISDPEFEVQYDTTGKFYLAAYEGYSNQIRLKHNFSGDLKSIYSFNLKFAVKPDTSDAGQSSPFTNGGYNGLSKDINGNEVGLRVKLSDNLGEITSSFYSSGSTNSGEFNYDHYVQPGRQSVSLFVYPSIAGSDEIVATPKGVGFYIGSSSAGSVTGYQIDKITGNQTASLDVSLPSEYNNTDYIRRLNFDEFPGLISTATNPGVINSVSGNTVMLGSLYLITSSIAATASYEILTKISASTEISITEDALYTIEDFRIGTASEDGSQTTSGVIDTSGLLSGTEFLQLLTNWPNGLSPYNYYSNLTSGVPRLKIYKNGTLVNTIKGSLSDQIAETGTTEYGRLKVTNNHIGYFSNGDTMGLHLDVVEEDGSTAIFCQDGEGFSIKNLKITGITSSLTASVTDTSFNNFSAARRANRLLFNSPMGSVGDASFPFDIGSITASIAATGSDWPNEVYLTEALFTTESILNAAAVRTSSQSEIDINWQSTLEIGELLQYHTTSSAKYDIYDWFKTSGSAIGDNEGITFFIKDSNTDEIMSSTFFDSSSILSGEFRWRLLSGGPKYAEPEVTSSLGGNIYLTIAATDTTRTPIPVSWSIGLHKDLVSTTLNGEEPYWAKLKPTRTSNTFPTTNVSQSTVDMFLISSSHVDQGPANSFTTGTSYVKGRVYQSSGDPSLSYIKLFNSSPTLFITASSEATASVAVPTYFLAATTASVSTTLPSPILEGNFNYNGDIYNLESVNNSTINLDTPILITDIDGEELTLNYYTTASNDYKIEFKNTHLIYEHEYQCSVDEDEYNFTQNVTARKNKSLNSSEIANNLISSINSNSQNRLFKPYATTVGLYDDNHNLLAVAKFAQPIRMSEETDVTFVIRYDT